MGLNLYNARKWIRMLTGRSILHVEQGIGRTYSLQDVKGYYNDLTKKVTEDNDENPLKVPVFKAENGAEILFPITIFQYGLGAYDLYLIEGKKLYLDKFYACVNWALANQQEDGSWDTFSFINPDAPYSAMAQGEGASLLLRAYKESNNDYYRAAAEKAVNFMLLPTEKGGTALYNGDDLILLEATNGPAILNGWIFSLFGLFDCRLAALNKEMGNVFERSAGTLARRLKDFDTGYWSKYDDVETMASPFYHRLHIAQLYVLYEMTGDAVFWDYHQKWKEYAGKFINRNRAFAIKAMQKIVER